MESANIFIGSLIFIEEIAEKVRCGTGLSSEGRIPSVDRLLFSGCTLPGDSA